ncbi:unnamed protein product [Musa textilis]
MGNSYQTAKPRSVAATYCSKIDARETVETKASTSTSMIGSQN